MDLNVLSLVISVVGLILGFVSTYDHFRRAFSRLVHTSDKFADQRLASRAEDAALFAGSPSALIAHTGRVLLQSVFALVATFGIVFVVLLQLEDLAGWVNPSISAISGIFIGLRLGSLSTTFRDVCTFVRKGHFAP